MGGDARQRVGDVGRHPGGQEVADARVVVLDQRDECGVARLAGVLVGQRGQRLGHRTGTADAPDDRGTYPWVGIGQGGGECLGHGCAQGPGLACRTTR
jgi:hypothetical protein